MAREIKTINLGFVNCYLVKVNDGFILIDTGIPFKLTDLEKVLSEQGCVPGNLLLIILTHGDIDHAGNCSHLREKYHVKIAMHRNDSRMVETGEMLRDRKVKSLFMKIMMKFMSGSKMYRKVMTGFEKFKPDFYLEEGNGFDEYGFEAKVVYIPGHTEGSIGILTSDGSFFLR